MNNAHVSGGFDPLVMDELPTLTQILDKPVMVSRHSRFDSDVWFLDGWTPGYTKRQFAIHWDVEADQRLIDGMKYVAALLFLERDGRRIYAHTTASTFSAGMRHLLRFMHRHGYASFGQFDSDGVRHFRRYLHVALSDPERAEEELVEDEERLPEEGADDGHAPMTKGDKQRREPREAKIIAEDEMTYSAAYNRLRPLQHLWDFRDELRAAGIDPLPSEPFPNSSARAEALDAAAVVVNLIPPLPDEVAIAIMSDAYRLIEGPAEDVIELQRRYLGEMARLDREPPTYERRRLQSVMEAFTFREVGGQTWRAPILLPPEEASGSETMHDLIDLIRNACILIIFSGTGCRISEVLSLETGGESAPLPLFASRQPQPSLPACVSVSRSKSGLHEHFHMHGKLSKNELTPKDEKWLIGSRPFDRLDVEPPVLRAIRVLERLFEPWRPLIANPRTRQALILTFRSRGLPRGGRSILPAGGSQVRRALNAYIMRPEVGLQKLKSAVRDNPKLRPYVDTLGRCIRPHQWRKTFALYMMRLDERMIPALAHHFKHLSIAVTEGAYMPQDPSMIAAGDSVHMMETQRALYELRRGAGSRFGNLDRTMRAFDDDLDRLLGDLPLGDDFERVNHALITRDIRIYAAEHGRCLIAVNPDKARCHSAGGTSSWKRLRPNYETRTPGLCAGCDNFYVSAENAGFWRRRYLDNQSAWVLAKRSLDFEVVRRRAEQAAAVLKALGHEVPQVSASFAAMHLAAVAAEATRLTADFTTDEGGDDASSTSTRG